MLLTKSISLHFFISSWRRQSTSDLNNILRICSFCYGLSWELWGKLGVGLCVLIKILKKHFSLEKSCKKAKKVHLDHFWSELDEKANQKWFFQTISGRNQKWSKKTTFGLVFLTEMKCPTKNNKILL